MKASVDEIDLRDIQTLKLLRERLESLEADLLQEEKVERREHLRLVEGDADA